MEQLLIERNILKKCICDVKELIVPEGVKNNMLKNNIRFLKKK